MPCGDLGHASSGAGVSHVTLAGVEAELLAESEIEVTVKVNSGDAKTGDVVLTSSTEATVALVDGSHTPLLELLTPGTRLPGSLELGSRLLDPTFAVLGRT